MIIPSKKIFLELSRKGLIPPLYKKIPYSSPCSIYKSFASADTFLLESVKGPERISRYSFIGFEPCLTLKVKDGAIEILGSDQKKFFSRHPLQVLRNLLNSYKQDPPDTLPPFLGGLVGMLSYDFVHYLEKLPRSAVDDLDLPDAHFLMIDELIAFDHAGKKTWIVVCPGAKDSIDKGTSDNLDWSEMYDKAICQIEKIFNRIEHSEFRDDEGIDLTYPDPDPIRKMDILYEMKKEQYMDIVKKAKEYIAAGDIFQANLSQRVSANIMQKKPWDLYRILRSINPSPFAAFMDFGDYQIVSSSPERLVRVNKRIIETRPIAGTRPRGKDRREDDLLRTELLLNEKERAEHIMLIDLERNDLGKVSEYGTVCVDEHMITEDYSHVIHIVSNVKGNLVKGKDCFDAIRATFPGGTITGVPKVRCMEIIDELEPVSRGPYTGSIGYVGFSGNMDLNIIIRTFVIKNNIACVQAGAGIVADSDPEREYFETLKKAEALIGTLERV